VLYLIVIRPLHIQQTRPMLEVEETMTTKTQKWKRPVRSLFNTISSYPYDIHPCPFPKLMCNSATVFSIAVAHGGRLNGETCECACGPALAESAGVDDQH